MAFDISDEIFGTDADVYIQSQDHWLFDAVEKVMDLINDRCYNILCHPSQVYYMTQNGKLQKKLVDRVFSFLENVYNQNEHKALNWNPNDGNGLTYCSLY